MSVIQVPQQAAPQILDTGVCLYRWTREEYHRATELGLFRPDARLELIRGEIYRKMPQSPPHAMGVRAVSEALETAFGPGFDIRQQLPLVLAADGEPEPDILVVPGSWRDYPQHPTQADTRLLVEVSDTTLHYDQQTKASLYAEAGIADYWIVNLWERAVEVYRSPGPFPDEPSHFGYQSFTLHKEHETITPLAAPHAVIRVADLLPPPQDTAQS
ncbi:MAG TPA: Uma2 family endonuclease [Chthonomonadaceae bacterium]|nr:Uma2 family endonuclease [Chthonomonadaceae bacterium]